MNHSRPKILYCEDNETLAFVTKDNLELRNYEVEHVSTGEKVLSALRTNDYDLLIMDIMLPGMDGLDTVEKVRERHPELPIIFLTALSLTEDRVKGLRLGADDYLTKPFSIEELDLRMKVCLRRKTYQPEEISEYRWGEIYFSYDKLILTVGGETLRLTQKEADVLLYFSARPNRVLKRAEILLEIWGEDDYFLGRSLDVFISRLRKYLSSDPSLEIANVHGVGFEFINPYVTSL